MAESLTESSIDEVQCEILLCERLAEAEGPRSCLRLCAVHLQQEQQRVRAMQQQTLEKIGELRDSLQHLQPRQQQMESDLRELEETFVSLQRCVQRWRTDITSRVAGQRESLRSKIQILRHVVTFEQQLQAAEEVGDFRRMHELLAQIEPSVEALCGKGKAMQHLLQEIDAAPADICSALRNVQFLLDRHVAPLCAAGGASVAAAAGTTEPGVAASSCMEHICSIPLGAEVECIAACRDSRGFCVDADGFVARGDEASGRRLPAPCAFVSLDIDTGAKHLLVVPLDLVVDTGKQQQLQQQQKQELYRCKAQINWQLRVEALLCVEQPEPLLLIAQGADGVAVCDLAGCVLHAVNANSLEHPLRCARGLALSDETVFILDAARRSVLAVGIQGWQLQHCVDFGSSSSNSSSNSNSSSKPTACALAASGSRLFVADTGRREVLKLCSITRRQLRAYSGFQRPAGLAVDSRGVLFVSDSWGQVVRLLLSDGSLADTLGQEGRPGCSGSQFDGPQGLALLQMGAGVEMLLLADWHNQTLRIFSCN